MTLYAQVTSGAIERVNIQLPTTINGTSIPTGATDLEQFGLYPIQGDEPAYNGANQRLTGPQYEFDGDAVQRVYVVEDISSTELQEGIWQRIKTIRDKYTQQGGYKAQGKWFHSDTFSRSQQLGLARKADRVEYSNGGMDTQFSGDEPNSLLFWKTMDGSFVPVTPRLAQSISDAAEQSDISIFKHAEQLIQQVKLSTNPTSIDIEQGWPETYKEV